MTQYLSRNATRRGRRRRPSTTSTSVRRADSAQLLTYATALLVHYPHLYAETLQQSPAGYRGAHRRSAAR